MLYLHRHFATEPIVRSSGCFPGVKRRTAAGPLKSTGVEGHAVENNETDGWVDRDGDRVPGRCPGTHAGEAQVWHIKAIDPSGHLLNVKAIDADGGIHDVKAIEQTGNRYILDVKAFVGGEILAVKVLGSDDWFGPVKAVRPDGSYLDIKAITADDQTSGCQGGEPRRPRPGHQGDRCGPPVLRHQGVVRLTAMSTTSRASKCWTTKLELEIGRNAHSRSRQSPAASSLIALGGRHAQQSVRTARHLCHAAVA